MFGVIMGGTGTVDATTGPARIPDCANPSYGGKVMPRIWDAGCTGRVDLYRNVRWSFWGDRYARGSGISSSEYRVKVTAFRPRMCLSRGTEGGASTTPAFA